MTTKDSIFQQFKTAFSSNPAILVSSPGRLNLLGEHTDYNNGFVLPAAIDKEAVFALSLNGRKEYRLISRDFDDSYATEVSSKSNKSWVNYLLGVVAQVEGKGHTVPGFDLVFGGDIPIGAGISSSAALECGLLFGLNHLLDLGLTLVEMATMAQKAEHLYAGVQCGIMDQFAVLHGKSNQVIKLDCRNLEFSYYPFSTKDHCIVLCNSGVKHSLASSEYNTRRRECELGIQALQTILQMPKISSLRDITSAQAQLLRGKVQNNVWQRCQYVVEEITRVEVACQALQLGDLAKLGELMYETHEGLKNQYEVSCPELDQLVEIAEQVDGVIGARMMGGGFGGCTINLVKEAALDHFVATVNDRYYNRKNKPSDVITTKINDGTRLV